MKTTDLAVVGAGPAGLAAAIEAASAGVGVLLVDENAKPGGQLFKQIHKFFGSKDHYAGTRGVDIGIKLLSDVRSVGVEVMLDTVVWGIFANHTLGVIHERQNQRIQAQCICLATGASENALAFPGWTLPGVMGAGAIQTLINVERVLPGKRVLMVGSGNVGLIVSYQLLQAGAQVVAVVEALPKVGGYGVHASKLRRNRVPILTSTTIKAAAGQNRVEKATTVALDAQWRQVPGTEREYDVDVICLALGLTPLSELAWMAGCQFAYVPQLGGHVPIHDDNMQTTVPGIYAAGDCAEAFDKISGKTIVSAIQPNAADQALVAALNMAGRKAELRGVTQINVLDTLGLVSASFGDWQGVPGGQHVELTDRAAGRHLSLQFDGDRVVGCNSIGWTDHVGVMRGLVEGQVRLGKWKDKLLQDPTLLMEAYLATAQGQAARSKILVG